MKCDDCKLARWRRTAVGRLHPDKTGRCGFEYQEQPLPQAFYWASRQGRPSGGFIKRGREFDSCPYYEAATHG